MTDYFDIILSAAEYLALHRLSPVVSQRPSPCAFKSPSSLIPSNVQRAAPKKRKERSSETVNIAASSGVLGARVTFKQIRHSMSNGLVWCDVCDTRFSNMKLLCEHQFDVGHGTFGHLGSRKNKQPKIKTSANVVGANDAGGIAATESKEEKRTSSTKRSSVPKNHWRRRKDPTKSLFVRLPFPNKQENDVLPAK
jgi:hypothetical protein